MMDYQTRPLLGPEFYQRARDAAHRAHEAARHQASKFHRHMTTGDHWYYSVLKMVSAFASVACAVAAVILLGYMVFLDNPDSQSYVVNTFFTEDYSTDTYSWPVLPSSWSGLPNQPPPNGQIFNHYYECLQTVQAGSAQCPASLFPTTTAYQACVSANYTANLTACNVWSSAYQSAWPAPGPYGKCISNSFGFNKTQYDAFAICLRLDIWPMYTVPQDIDSTIFLGSFNWALFAVVAFSILSAFAMYTFWPQDFEEPLMIEYGKPVSSFARLGIAWIVVPILLTLLVAVAALMVAFRIGAWTQNNPYPTTISTNSVVVTFALGFLVYFVLEWLEFWDQTKGRKDRSERGPRIRPEDQASADVVYAQQMDAAARQDAMFYHLGAANPDPARREHSIPANSVKEATKLYTPTLMVAWSDAYITDALFLLAFLGSTLQVDTDDSYNVFWGVLFYRVAQAAQARMVYEAYIKNDAESKTANQAKEKNGVFGWGRPGTEARLAAFDPRQAHAPYYDRVNWPEEIDTRLTHLAHIKYTKNAVFSAKVQALSIHLASVLALCFVMTILFNPNKAYVEYPMLVCVAVFCFIIPEALRLVGHVTIAVFSETDYSVTIALFVQTIWCWDLLMRLIFIVVLYGDASGNTPGSRTFLTYKTGNLTNAIGFLQTFP